MNKMKFKDIKIEGGKLSQIISEWCDNGGCDGLEKDLIMDKLRYLYDAVRFAEASSVEVDGELPVLESHQRSVSSVSVLDNDNDLMSFPKELEIELSEESFEMEDEYLEIIDIVTNDDELSEELFEVEDIDVTDTIADGDELEVELSEELFEEGNDDDELELFEEPMDIEEVDQKDACVSVVEDDEIGEEFDDIAMFEIDSTEQKGVDLINDDYLDVRLAGKTTNPKEEKSGEKVISSHLFDLNDIELRKHKQRAILSLYNDDCHKVMSPRKGRQVVANNNNAGTIQEFMGGADTIDIAQKNAEAFFNKGNDAEDDFEIEEFSIDTNINSTNGDNPNTFSIVDKTTILGDVINGNVKTLADTMVAAPSDVINFDHIDDIRDAIGVNDRFLLIVDLFKGNEEEYDRVMEIINSFDDINDCMIYIVENHCWNPNSDGAKLIGELIERKYIE